MRNKSNSRTLPLAAVALVISACLANAATFIVTTNAEIGPGSLRRAINDANATSGRDVITFNLRPSARTILLQSQLPRITNAVEIDASAQPGVKLIGPGNLIGLEVAAPNTTIRGIALEDFEQGIRIIAGRSNHIEGCTIVGNSLWGIALEGGSNHTILANVISGNRIGISDGFGSRGTNVIRGNLIGTDASGTNVLGNVEYGISGAGYSRLVIGGREAGQGNVTSGNGTGISLKLFGKVPSIIQGNFIGTDRTGTLNLGNTWAGVSLDLGSNHVGGIEAGAGNVIAFNGRNGVVADPPTWIQGNHIFANGLLGIEYANADYPILSYAIASQSSTLISGALAGTPQASYRIELFASDACDPSGFGEGERFLGFTTATPDASGNASFTFDFPEALPVPSIVTATATSVQGGTSRFSRCQPVLSPESLGLSVWQTDHPDPAPLRSYITYTITISNTGPSRATNVILENVFPHQPRFGFVPGLGPVPVQPSQGSCSNSFDRTVCFLGNLEAGASASAIVTVYPYSAGYFTNKAVVTSASPDGSLADNVSEEITTVGLADLGLTMSTNAPPYRAGEAFALTLHLTNAGPSTAERAEIFLSSSYNVSFSPSTVYVTNLPAGGSRDIVVSAVPLTNSYFSAYAGVYAGFGTDPIHTNDSVALFGYADPGPGVLILERNAYAIQENGQAILRVLRVGGAEGALSVAYATSNGTAVANSDYIPAAGELVFPPGKTEAQIVVPSIADETPECNEFFSVHLFSADDATVLGLTTSALVSIAERPPTLAGYIRPITVSAADPRLLVGGDGWPVRVSADGRKILFNSYAREIVEPPSTGFGRHLFIRDLETRTTLKLTPAPNTINVNVSIFEYHSPILSGNGNVAAFGSSYWSNGYYSDLIVQDLASGSNLIVMTATNLQTFRPLIISSNGTTVVLNDSSNHLHALDLLTGSNQLISAAHDGTLPPGSYATATRVSDDGRFVLFESYASLLTNDLNSGSSDLYLRDLVTHTTHLLSMDTNGVATGSNGGDMSADGRWVTFEAFGAGIVPEVSDWYNYIYLRDMISGTTRLVSTNFGGASFYSPQISADGRFIAFSSYPFYGEQTDIFLHDTQTGATTLVTRSCSGQARVTNPRLSGDGRFVFFESSDIDFGDGEYLPKDNNIFRWDRLTEQTTLISVNKNRTGGARGWENVGETSHDGNVLAFTSESSDLAFGDNSGSYDVFVWQAGVLPRLSISLAAGIVTVSWPIDSPAAVLEQRTPESNWVPVTGPIQQELDRYTYQIAIAGASPLFFQLRFP